MNPITPHAFPNSGGKQRPPDHRDLMSGAAGTYDFPPSIMNATAFAAPIYFQGHRPACGAHAGVWYKVFLDMLAGKASANYTPRFTWINIKRDGTGVSDGTDMRSIFESLRKYGADDFEPLENNVTYGDADYAHTTFVTPAMLQNGAQKTIASYAFLNDHSFSGIKQAIKDNGAVLILMKIGEPFWTTLNGQSSWLEKDILPLRPPHPVVSGHFAVAHSYDEQYIYFANSFGPTWGRKGHGYFGANYMPYVLEAGFMRNQPASAPTPVQQAQAIAVVQEGLTIDQELPVPQRAWFLQVLMDFLKSFQVRYAQGGAEIPVKGGTIVGMNPQKQFTGFLSSVANPGQLSDTVSSITNALLSAAAFYAVVHGLDATAVTNQVQAVINQVATVVTAGLMFYHTLKAAFSLARKLWYQFAAKPVVSVPAAVPVAVPATSV